MKNPTDYLAEANTRREALEPFAEDHLAARWLQEQIDIWANGVVDRHKLAAERLANSEGLTFDIEQIQSALQRAHQAAALYRAASAIAEKLVRSGADGAKGYVLKQLSQLAQGWGRNGDEHRMVGQFYTNALEFFNS